MEMCSSSPSFLRHDSFPLHITRTLEDVQVGYQEQILHSEGGQASKSSPRKWSWPQASQGQEAFGQCTYDIWFNF